MKKLIVFFAVLILIGNLAGCGIQIGNNNAENNKGRNNSTANNNSTSDNNKGEKEPTTNSETINDYYPMKKNIRYI